MISEEERERALPFFPSAAKEKLPFATFLSPPLLLSPFSASSPPVRSSPPASSQAAANEHGRRRRIPRRRAQQPWRRRRRRRRPQAQVSRRRRRPPAPPAAPRRRRGRGRHQAPVGQAHQVRGRAQGECEKAGTDQNPLAISSSIFALNLDLLSFRLTFSSLLFLFSFSPSLVQTATTAPGSRPPRGRGAGRGQRAQEGAQRPAGGDGKITKVESLIFCLPHRSFPPPFFLSFLTLFLSLPTTENSSAASYSTAASRSPTRLLSTRRSPERSTPGSPSALARRSPRTRAPPSRPRRAGAPRAGTGTACG